MFYAQWSLHSMEARKQFLRVARAFDGVENVSICCKFHFLYRSKLTVSFLGKICCRELRRRHLQALFQAIFVSGYCCSDVVEHRRPLRGLSANGVNVQVSGLFLVCNFDRF